MCLSPNRGAGHRSRYLRLVLFREKARRPCVEGIYWSLGVILTILCVCLSGLGLSASAVVASFILQN